MTASFPPRRLRPRFSLRWKITLPFMILALALGLGVVYILNQIQRADEQERMLRQLTNSGQQAADGVVRAESALLNVERLIAFTEGVPEAVAQEDAETLRESVLPVVVTAGADVVVILDRSGTSVLAIRRRPQAEAGTYEAVRGETFYSDWTFVQQVLQGKTDEDIGDKQAGLELVEVGDLEVPVFFVGGPVKDAQGAVSGAVLVGEYIPGFGNTPGLVQTLREQAGANVAVYGLTTGELLASSFKPEGNDNLKIPPEMLAQAANTKSTQSPLREITVAGSAYSEVLTPLLARHGTLTLGLLGVSLSQVPVEVASSGDLRLLVRYGAVAVALVVVIGLLISNTITRPLVAIAEASAQVADGNLETRVAERGGDEIGVLARSFNRMVEGLQEGWVDRGPASRPGLGGGSAPALIGGQKARATILYAELTGLPEQVEDVEVGQVMASIREYFAGASPIVVRHGGVVSRFEGGELMAFFGVLPRQLPPAVSALQGTHAAMSLLEFLQVLNDQRQTRGEVPLSIGVGVTTGWVIAGGLDCDGRTYYTVVGEAVDTAHRIQQITREMGGATVVIGETTHQALGGVKGQFRFGRFGRARLPGREDDVAVYEVVGRTVRLVGPGGAEAGTVVPQAES
jgi:class 3 adenylate cyclase